MAVLLSLRRVIGIPVSAKRTTAELRQRQLAAVKTGVYVKAENGIRLRTRRVRRLVRKMERAMPWLTESDEPACRAWAELELLGGRAFGDLWMRGMLTDTGEPRRLLSELRQIRQAQLAYERELGMTPLAKATLKVSGARGKALNLVTQLAAEAAAVPIENTCLEDADDESS